MAQTAAGARLAARNRLRNRLDKATPIGRAIIDHMLALNLGVGETAPRVGLGRDELGKLLWRQGRWARLRTRQKMADFLGVSSDDVERLLLEGGGTWQRRGGGALRREGEPVTCHLRGCENVIRRTPSKMALGLRSFCCRRHAWDWMKGRRKVPVRGPPRSRGQRTKARPGGRRQERLLREGELPSFPLVAEVTGLNPTTLCLARGGKPCRLIVRYVLEQTDFLPRHDWSPLTVEIMDFCLGEKIKPKELKARAGIADGSNWKRILRDGHARRATLGKLAAAMDRQPEDLERLCDPDRYRTHRPAKPSRGRRRGRPQSYTDAEALQVWDWRQEAPPVPWAEIGRRISWPLKRNRLGVPCDCPKARRAHAHALGLVTVSP